MINVYCCPPLPLLYKLVRNKSLHSSSKYSLIIKWESVVSNSSGVYRGLPGQPMRCEEMADCIVDHKPATTNTSRLSPPLLCGFGLVWTWSSPGQIYGNFVLGVPDIQPGPPSTGIQSGTSRSDDITREKSSQQSY